MGRVTFACVRSGAKYSDEYVKRLRDGIARNYAPSHDFICLSDQPGQDCVDIRSSGLAGWWPKILLFSPAWRGKGRTVYIDLDTVICGDLAPLVGWDGEFGICENFTRLAGHSNWPCRYGSCVMSFAPGWGEHIFEEFWEHREALMRDAWRYGDQLVIEQLAPFATLLQSELPAGYFLNKRDLPKYADAPPPEASIVVFGGNQRPDNCQTKWVRELWR